MQRVFAAAVFGACILACLMAGLVRPASAETARLMSDRDTERALLDLFGPHLMEAHEAELQARRSGHPMPRARAHGQGRAPLKQSITLAYAEAHGDPPVVVESRGSSLLPGLPGSLIAVAEGVPSAAARGSSTEPGPPPGKSVARAGDLGSVSEAVGPVALTAGILESPQPSHGGLLLPFESGVGAAAFTMEGDIIVVFDKVRPLDLSAVQGDPLGAGSSVRLLPQATVLRLPWHRPDGLSLRRTPAGWLIQARGAPDDANSIALRSDRLGLRFAVSHPGRTVIVPDPRTGGNLLVGTLRDGQEAIAHTCRGSAAAIERTFLGVVVVPWSDRLELRPTPGAFLLSGLPGDELDNSRGQLILDGESHDLLSRVMSLDAGPIAMLRRRLQEAKAEAAAAPASARFLPRLHAAEDALALDDAKQAATIMRVASADDARAASDLRPRLVASAAAVLDHGPDPSSLLDDPKITGETALWRAVRLAELNPASSEAARLFAANLSILRSYPAPLQDALLPIAAESLVQGGTTTQAQLVAHLPGAVSLAFARALLSARRGDVASALALLDQLAASRDWALGEKAAAEAAMLRQKQKGSDPRALADLLEGRLLDARIGGNELARRFQLIDLRMQAGQWQKALDLLKSTALLFPERTMDVRGRVAALLRRLVNSPGGSAAGRPFDEVAVIESGADMLPDSPEGAQISSFLATRLAGLDLPDRAAPIVQRMMRKAPVGVRRSQLGLTLAALDFQRNNLDGVRAALQESDSSDMPPSLTEARSVILARALAARGHLDQALLALGALRTNEALDLKASLLANNHDWAEATECLTDAARQRLPASGKLDAAGEDLLLRLASFASRTGDRAAIARTRALGDGRFADGGKAVLFALLTSDPKTDRSDDSGGAAKVLNLGRVIEGLDSVAQ